jgi:hypothetical protein
MASPLSASGAPPSISSHSTSPIGTPPLTTSPRHTQHRQPPQQRTPAGLAGGSGSSVSAAAANGGARLSAPPSESGAVPDWDDARSEVSAASYNTGPAALDGASGSVTTPRSAGPPSLGGGAPPHALMAADGGGGGPPGDPPSAVMRLGLRLEQRSDVRRLVDGLARGVRQAGDDLAAAVDEIHQLRANNGALAAQLAAATGGGGPGAWEELQRQLAAVSWSPGES